MTPDSEPRRTNVGRSLGTAIVGALALGLVALLLVPAIQRPTSGPRHPCVNNLKMIGLALSNYHAVHRTFPPAFIPDEQGNPMHSWRVLILPFLDEVELSELYDFNEPWNGPLNRQLANRIPSVYRCPDCEATQSDTSYVAVVGTETGWPAPEGIELRQFTDGTSHTIAVVEAAEPGIHWMEPRDLTFDEAVRGVNRQGIRQGVSSNHSGFANVVFFDSHVEFLPNDTPPETLRALLTANGSERAEPPQE